jgi:hypothetical protein
LFFSIIGKKEMKEKKEKKKRKTKKKIAQGFRE